MNASKTTLWAIGALVAGIGCAGADFDDPSLESEMLAWAGDDTEEALDAEPIGDTEEALDAEPIGDVQLGVSSQALRSCSPAWRLVEKGTFQNFCHVDKDNQLYGYKLELYTQDRYHDDAGCYEDSFLKRKLDQARCSWNMSESDCMNALGLFNIRTGVINEDHCGTSINKPIPLPRQRAETTCSTPPSQRIDAGWKGISAATCIARNACWDKSVRGVPWCFEKRGASPRPKCKLSGAGKGLFRGIREAVCRGLGH